jgi:hypothetical protein
MVDMLKNAMSPSKEAARLAGELTSKELAAGLRSADPAVRAQAIAVRDEILSRLGALRDSTGSIGKVAMDELRAGLKSKDPLIRQTAHDSMVVLMTGLADRASQATPAGKAAMDALVVGLGDKDPEIRKAAADAIAVATAALSAGAGAAGTAGEAYGAAFAAGVRRVISSSGVSRYISTGTTGKTGLIYEGRAAGGSVTAGYPYIVNENTPRSEWFVPETSGRILTADQAAGQGLGRGGDTFAPVINLGGITVGSDVSPGAARRFGQAVADEVANVLQEQNARFTSRLRVARA